MYCGKCGKEVKEEKFCSNCGNKIEVNKNQESKIDNKPKTINKKVAILITIIVLVFICQIIVYVSGSSKENSTTSNTTETTTSNATKTLSLDDIEMKSFTSISQANESTQRVFLAGWSYITGRSYNGYPNAKICKVWIAQKDGYGRFAVNYSFLKNPNTSETTTAETVYVWVKDINDKNKIGYYYYYGQNIGWGTPLTESET